MTFLNRMTVRQKLGVLGLIALIALLIPSVLLTQKLLADLRVTQRSASSEMVFKDLLEGLRNLQASRGLAAGVLAGNGSMDKTMQERQAQALSVLAATRQEMTKTDAGLALVERVSLITKQFDELKEAVQNRKVTPAESFSRHTQLIADVLALLDLVMDDYGLSLEPHPDLYFLMQGSLVHMPWLTEHLGQMRGLGNGLLANQQMSVDGRLRLTVMIDAARLRANQAQLQVNKSLPLNGDFANKLTVPLQQAMLASQEVIDLAKREILDTATPSIAPAEFFKQATVSIDAVFNSMGTASEAIDQQLHANVDQDLFRLGGAASALVLLLVLLVATAIAVTRSITLPLNQAIQLANAVAEGDLTEKLHSEGETETAKLLRALMQMQTNLTRVVHAVRDNAGSVFTASNEIAQGADDLSRRTEAQASSLEETAASMEELGATVGQNTEHIQAANQSASKAAAVAQTAGEVVAGFVHTMQEIHTSSSRIRDIISVIDGIAFQTNILALNAAVEAARAGEAGRGFAVVASEVRSLAQRSAEAAKQIKDLITESVNKVETGSAQIEQARRTVLEVVVSIGRVSEMMGQVNLASQEQSAGVGQVTQAVSEMDQVTQQNAALVEQSAAAAATLSQQAGQLEQAVAFFKLQS